MAEERRVGISEGFFRFFLFVGEVEKRGFSSKGNGFQNPNCMYMLGERGWDANGVRFRVES